MLTKNALHCNEKHHHKSISKTSTINVKGCQRFLVQIVLVPKAASLEYEFRKQSLHLKKKFTTLEPRYNDRTPRYN